MAAEQGTVVPPPVLPLLPRCIPPRDPDDVLFDQLRFLLRYHGVDHPGGFCVDCQRMAMIRVALLRPFTSERRMINGR